MRDDIAYYIPVGHENAISRQQLCIRTGLGDRQVREAVKASQILICNLSDGNGYFIPTEEETRLVKAFKRQEGRRTLSSSKTVKKCDQWLKSQAEKNNDLKNKQMSIFDMLGGADG